MERLLRFKNLSLTLASLLFTSLLVAQQSVTSVPPLNGGNGQTGITFNVTAINSLIVTGLSCTVYGSSAGTYQIWYRTTPINGAPTVSTAGGWIMAATGTVTPGGTATTNNPPVLLTNALNIPMNSGAQYGFAINMVGASVAYTTWSSANQQTFSDANLSFFTGNNVGYGGPMPNPTFHPRQFNGTVHYTLSSQYDDDASVNAIISPEYFCANETVPLVVNVHNSGLQPLDSCMVVWDVNGTLDSAWYTVNLDTFGGTGPLDTVLFLDSITTGTGALNIYAYSKWPNGQLDSNSSNDSSDLALAGPSLQGNYVIGTGTGADYASFTAAVAALHNQGVCDAVVFDVQSGTYTEQIAINEIIGASQDNTITFRSLVQDSSAVVLTFAGSTQTSVVRLNGADWIRFEKITLANTSTTYDIAFEFTSGANNNVVSNCHLIGNVASTSTFASLIYSSGGNDNDNRISNNRFEGGGMGMYWLGTSTTSFETGTVIENNEFVNQYYRGFMVYYQDGAMVKKNHVKSNANYTAAYGMYFLYSHSMELLDNHVEVDPNNTTNWPLYGIFLSTCNGQSVNSTGLIANNRVVVGADTTATSATTFYGIYLSGCNAQRIYNNTVVARSGSASTRAWYHASCNIIYVQNNVFTTWSGGHAAYYGGGIAAELDNNVYWAPNGFEIFDIATNYTLAQFQDATGWESHGMEADPEFSDLYEALFCNADLDGIAEVTGYVANDYSGYPRHPQTPDPGAAEFIGMEGFSLGPDSSYCADEHVIEVTGPASSIVWLVNGQASSGSSITLQAGSQPTTFTVNVALTSATGCGSAADFASITLIPSATLDSNVHLCADESESISVASGGSATYMWMPGGETTGSITVSEPGTYSVTKMEEGCVSSASTIVTQSTAVDVADVEACLVDMPITVDATIPAGVGYAWNGGSSLNSAVNTFDAAGIYQVTTTDAFGCTSSDELTVSVLEAPVANITHDGVANYFFFNSSGSLFAGTNASYFWTFGDGTTSTEANPGHGYNWSSQPTSYTVTLTITNDCGTDDVSVTVISNPTGIANYSAAPWLLVPNPATDRVEIQNTTPGTSFTICDATGRVILSETAKSNNLVFDVSELSNGAYVVSAIGEGQTGISKLIVSK